MKWIILFASVLALGCATNVPIPPPPVAPALTYPFTPTAFWTSSATYGVARCYSVDAVNLLCQ